MSKEHAYAYEAGYRDGSIHYELEHCPACKNVADLQEALAENAKLWEQIHWLKQGEEAGGGRVKITIFSEELRKCLNAAGLSDCGENDTWNYWYQRLMNAYNESVERQIMTEKAENAKLREQVASFIELSQDMVIYAGQNMKRHFAKRLRKLGVPL